MTKIKVTVIYGGQSVEHEVSCRSAGFILQNLNPKKYQVEAIGINKEGRWLLQDAKILGGGDGTKPIPISSGREISERGLPKLSEGGEVPHVVFPIIHGTGGEDGTLQGFLEMANVAYVGADTLSSALGMDKVMAKRIVAAAEVLVGPFIETRELFWRKDKKRILSEALATLGLPIFVKPARLGSSVGITKVKTADRLEAACEEALRFDEKILLEKGLDAREIEVAVLGDADPEVSLPGEIIMRDAEFYDYQAKYLNETGAEVVAPAKLSAELTRESQRLAKKIFQALDLYGMARIDLFLERKKNLFYFNEVNTAPGFTSISQYPKLWEASGKSAEEVVDRLIALALARHDQKTKMQRSFVALKES